MNLLCVTNFFPCGSRARAMKVLWHYRKNSIYISCSKTILSKSNTKILFLTSKGRPLIHLAS